MLFWSSKYAHDGKAFAHGLTIILIIATATWTYLFLNYQTAPTETKPHRSSLRISLTKAPVFSSRERIQPQRIPNDKHKNHQQNLTSKQLIKKHEKALLNNASSVSSLEQIMSIKLDDNDSQSNSNIQNKAHIFSRHLREKIDSAKRLKSTKRNVKSQALLDANSYTDIHGSLYAQSENGCVFRRKMVDEQDIWYSVGCSKTEGIEINYRNQFKKYASFE